MCESWRLENLKVQCIVDTNQIKVVRFISSSQAFFDPEQVDLRQEIFADHKLYAFLFEQSILIVVRHLLLSEFFVIGLFLVEWATVEEIHDCMVDIACLPVFEQVGPLLLTHVEVCKSFIALVYVVSVILLLFLACRSSNHDKIMSMS